MNIYTSNYLAEINQTTPSEWSHILSSFKDSTIYQTWEYASVKWGANNLDHIIIKHNGTVVAATQIIRITLPIVGVSIAYVTWGPLWKRYDSQLDHNVFRIILRTLKSTYGTSNTIIRIRPHGFDDYDSNMKRVLLNEGFRITEGMFRENLCTMLINLSYSEQELRKRLTKSWRNSLNKGIRENLSITERYDEQSFAKLKPLFDQLVKKKKFIPGSTIDQLEKVQVLLNAKDRLRVTLVEADGIAIAGSVCSDIGDTVIGMVGAANEEGRRRRAYYVLQWDEIMWAKNNNKSLYDLSGMNRVKNPSVYHHKSGLKGEEVTYLGVYDYCNNALLYRIMLIIENMFSNLSRYNIKNTIGHIIKKTF